MKNILTRLLNLSTEYERLFFKNEFAVFAGKNNGRLLRLIFILFITFLALSFANGSYNYLRIKMNNPFTNWVNLPIETDNNSRYKKPIKEHFEKAEAREVFNLKPLAGYLTYSPTWYNRGGERIIKRGRSVDVYDDILKVIFSDDSLKIQKKDFLFTDTIDKAYHYDIIVTSDFIEKLNYSPSDDLRRIKYANFDSNNNDLSFWVDILAIAKDLPNQCDFIFFPNLYNSINNENDSPVVSSGKGNQFQILSKSNDVEAVTNEVIAAFGAIGQDINTKDTETKPFKISQTDQRVAYKFYFENGVYSHRELTSILKKHQTKQATNFEYFIEKQKSNKLESVDPYQYAFNFKDLSKVRDFYKFMKKTFNVSIEMSQIESKENFAYVSALTLVTSFVIFVLSLTTIIIYLINLLSTHLNGIKKNLGTYKAFGLSDAKLNSIYLKIVFAILCIGLLVSFVLIFIIAQLGLIDDLLRLFNSSLDDKIKSISVFNSWNLAAILLLLGLSVFLTHHTIKKILNKTPGDLIYNRT